MRKEICYVTDPIVLHIWVSLHNYDYNNAIFAAEHLYAEVKSEECLYILATCFYRNNKPKQALSLLKSKGYSIAKCRYLFARCSFETGLVNEAETALSGPLFSSRSVEDISNDFGEQAAYALLLLGDIYRFTYRVQKAKECYVKCLELNPLLWTAYETLCQLGEDTDPKSVFFVPTEKEMSTCTLTITPIHVNHSTSLARHQNNSTLSNQDGNNIYEEIAQENLDPNNPIESPALNSSIDLFSSSPESDRDDLNTIYQRSTTLQSSEKITTPSASIVSTPSPHQLAPQQRTKGTSQVSNNPNGCESNTTASKKQRWGRNLFATTFSGFTGSETIPHPRLIVQPTFGQLGLDILSPMFACLPVLSSESLPSTIFNQTSTSLPVLPNDQSSVGSPSDSSPAPARHLRSRDNVLGDRPPSPAVVYRRLGAPVSPLSAAGMLQSGGISSPAVLRSSHRSGQVLASSPPPPPLLSPSNHDNTLSITRQVSPSSQFQMEEFLLFGELDSQETKENHYLPGGTAPVTHNNGSRSRIGGAVSRTSTRRMSRSKDADEELTAQHSSSEVQKETISADSLSSQDPRRQSLDNYLALLCSLGSIYRLVAGFQSVASVQVEIDRLVTSQQKTSRVEEWLAQAHMDSRDYQSVVSILSTVHQQEPWRVSAMDIYSTALWFLNKEVALSALSTDLLQLDQCCPQVWCVVGNCFSLHREHSVAMKFFRRAIQVDPHFPYAYTLLGHELTDTEDFSRASIAFRQALRLDLRHYRAWFGLSNVYFRQDQFSLAELHLSRAASLLPDSVLLLAHLGLVRARLGRIEGPGGALECLDRACKQSPRNIFARYHRALLWVMLDRRNEAIVELEQLRKMAPRESIIYFLLGRLYKQAGSSPQALLHFSWAMELDPRGASSQLMTTSAGPLISSSNSATVPLSSSPTFLLEEGIVNAPPILLLDGIVDQPPILPSLLTPATF